jgi:diacylglycerol kinase family enzyme
VGLRRVQSMSGVQTIRSSKIELLNGVDLQLDGEYADSPPVQIDIVPNGLTLLMPPSYG